MSHDTDPDAVVQFETHQDFERHVRMTLETSEWIETEYVGENLVISEVGE